MSRGLPEIPAHLTVPFACPNCRGPMKTVRNPSYGIGLARHHYLRVCVKCGHVLFVPESLIAARPQPEKKSETKLEKKSVTRPVKKSVTRPVKRLRLGRKKKDGD
jgi:hypothetical protein